MSLLHQGLALHRRGNYAGARACYQARLRQVPGDADAHHLIGMAWQAEGKLEEAGDWIRRAIQLAPQAAPFHNNLGWILWQQGQGAKSEASCRRAIQLRPGYAEAWCNLGNALQLQDRWAKAVPAYQRAIELKPDYAKALSNLGEALRHLGQHDRAAQACRRAIAVQPNSATAHLNLGLVLISMGKLPEALASLRLASQRRGDHVPTWLAKARAHSALSQWSDAEAAYARVIELAPTSTQAWRGLAYARYEQGDLQTAQQYFAKVVSLEPDAADDWHNLGEIQRQTGRASEAIVSLERSLAIRTGSQPANTLRPPSVNDAGLEPPQAISLCSLAMARLQQGEFSRGWSDYGARLVIGRGLDARDKSGPGEASTRWINAAPDVRHRLLDYRDAGCRRWRGEAIRGRKILVWGEQGIGDEIMFASVLPDLLATGACVTLECVERLEPLFRRSFPTVRVVRQSLKPSIELSELDFHVPLGDLPRFFRQSWSDFGTARAYLKSDVAQRDRLIKKYQAIGNQPRVGISWRSDNPLTGAKRTVPLHLWTGLLSLPHLRFFSLQYGDFRAELEAIRVDRELDLVVDPEVDPLGDLDRFAAQVDAMDLIISIDNSTVHVAGALGKPVWCMLPVGGDWRWFQDRTDSPWYPSLHLFRRTAASDATRVLAEVQLALQTWRVLRR